MPYRAHAWYSGLRRPEGKPQARTGRRPGGQERLTLEAIAEKVDTASFMLIFTVVGTPIGIWMSIAAALVRRQSPLVRIIVPPMTAIAMIAIVIWGLVTQTNGGGGGSVPDWCAGYPIPC